jgi:glycosyltransferase involved in cell wall biosynthesis
MSPSSPLVSIILPSYNHARFLAKRLSSIAAQTYSPVEIIILDDASTDGSQSRLKEFAQTHPTRLLLSESNSGSPFAQWNKGAAAAKGDLLWFAESDDFCDSTFLQKLVPYFINDPDVGLAYCRSWRVSESDEKIDIVPLKEAAHDPRKFESNFVGWGREEITSHLAVQSSIPNASGALVKRELFLSCGGAPTHMKLCGDWLAWLKVLRSCKLAYHAEPLNFFRAPHPKSQRLTYQKQSTRIREWIEVQNFLAAQGLIAAKQRGEARDYLAQMTLESALHWLQQGNFVAAFACYQQSKDFDPLSLPRGAWAALRKYVFGARR